MGNISSLEKENRIDIRNTKINRAILASIGIGGLMAVAAITPGAFSYLRRPLGRLARSQCNSALRRLVEKGYVEFVNEKGSKFVSLTQKGQLFLEKTELLRHGIKPPKRWDGKWRVVIFDIPEYKQSSRKKIRETLMKLGFACLQRSVWVFPYDCEELITMIKLDIKAGKGMLYMIVDKIENDRWLRERFGLSKR